MLIKWNDHYYHGGSMVLRRQRRRFPLRVEDIMSTPPITVSQDTTVEEAAKIMFDNRIGSVMVVDNESKLVGIMTERDLIFAVAEGKTCAKLPVWEIMAENPITASPQDLVTDALKKMREARIRHLPVVGEDGKPVGMVSMRDIADVLMLVLSLVGSL
jgi:CBS domain-containing protein